MPTYSYSCDACHREWEHEQRISDAPLKKCPACGKGKARRMISSGNFILKGGGWYSDGYGAGASTRKNVDTSTTKDTATTTPSSSSDSTTPVKTEPKPAKASDTAASD